MVDIVGNALDSGRHFNLHQKRNYPYNKIEFFFFLDGGGERVYGGLPTMPTEILLSDGSFICCSWALLFLNGGSGDE
jgi:hypothetical protein